MDTREVVEESVIIMVEAKDVLLEREVMEVIIIVDAEVILALNINQTPGVYA